VSWFWNLFDARNKITAWRAEYNSQRPHSALRYLTPEEFARHFRPGIGRPAIGTLASVGLACKLECGDNRGRWQAQGSDMDTPSGVSVSWNLPLPPWKIFGALDLASLMSALSRRQLENRLDAFAKAMQWLANIVGGVSAGERNSFPVRSRSGLQRYWERRGERSCPDGDCRIDVEISAGRAFIF
jgi:hypothetical protein